MLSNDDLLRMHAQLVADIRDGERERDLVVNMLRRRGVDPEAQRQRRGEPPRARKRSANPSRPGGYVKGGTADAIMSVLADDQEWRNQDVAARIGVTPTACSAAMRRLVKKGKVVETGYGRYKRAQTTNGHHENGSVAETAGLFTPGDRDEGGVPDRPGTPSAGSY
jgi:hypothetical protein